MTAIETVLAPTFPPLAWLARLDHSTQHVAILHGRLCEAGEWGVVEGVWPGSFSDLEFADSEVFFGSGLRLEGTDIVCSPSRALVDRLWSGTGEGRTFISNSLPLLLAATGARLRTERSYIPESHSVLAGVDRYQSHFPVASESITVRQHYYHPFVLEPPGQRVLPISDRFRFDKVEAYVEFLDSRIASLLENAASPERRQVMEPFVALSRGYDSVAVAALLSQHVTAAAFTSRRSNSMLPSWLSHEAAVDDGSPVARALSLPVFYADENETQHRELTFYAGAAAETELAFGGLFHKVEASALSAMVFTGYHGDKVWSRNPGRAHLSDEIKRGDVSGLPLSEARLWAGVINVALPFLGARSIRDLVTLSNSPDLRPWSVGGDYDRPIPRRIAEEAGVPRELFGHRKRAVVATPPWPKSKALRTDFLSWLARTHALSPKAYRARVYGSRTVWPVTRALQILGSRIGLPMREADTWPLLPAGAPTSLLYAWATDRLTEEYGVILKELPSFS